MALSMTAGRSSKSVMTSEKSWSRFCSSCGREWAGMMRIVRELSGSRRRLISVAKRVHRLSLRGNGISVVEESAPGDSGVRERHRMSCFRSRLRWEKMTCVRLTRRSEADVEGRTSQGLEEGALPRRLVTAHHDLREGQNAVETTFADLGDCVQDTPLLVIWRLSRDEVVAMAAGPEYGVARWVRVLSVTLVRARYGD
jgi:hypothetical protein